MKTLKIIFVFAFFSIHDLMFADVPEFDPDIPDNAAPIDQSWFLVILTVFMLAYLYLKLSRNFSKR